MQQLSIASKQMFLTADMFNVERQRVHTDKNSILLFLFC